MVDTPDSLRVTLNIAGKDFQLNSSPFINEPKYATDFYQAIGKLVFVSGRLEYMFDYNLRWAYIIATRFGMKERIETAFGKKITLIRKIFRECEPLQHYSETLEPVLVEMKAVSLERNLIIHSHHEGFEDGDPPRLKFENRRVAGDMIAIRKMDVSVDELNALVERTNRLLPVQTALIFKVISIQSSLAKADKAAAANPSQDHPSSPTQK
jgi:hypothetical protein